ncbi:MAG: hypothetical protein ACPGXX_09135 [Planctomycetaceae bacterium]
MNHKTASKSSAAAGASGPWGDRSLAGGLTGGARNNSGRSLRLRTNIADLR